MSSPTPCRPAAVCLLLAGLSVSALAVDDGSTFTVTGSGFGTNPTYASSWLGGKNGYIQSAANDASFASAPPAHWSALINDWRIATANPRSSIRQNALHWQPSDSRNNPATKYAGTMLFDSGRATLQSCYIHYLQYFTHDAQTMQYKQLRLTANAPPAPYNDGAQPNMYLSAIISGGAAQDGIGSIALNGTAYQGKYGHGAEFYGDVASPNVSTGRPITEGTWIRTEWEFLDSTGTSANGFLRIRHTNAVTGAAIGLMEMRNLQVYSSTSQPPIAYIVPQLYTEVQPAASPNGAGTDIWMQDWMIKVGTRARVILGNAATFSQTMLFEVCNDLSWSDTQIQFEVNQGAFPDLANKYIYVFKSDGTLVSTTGIPLSGGTPANVAPVVAATIPNQIGTVGTAFSYTIPAGTFTDADGDTLTWSATGLPAGLSFTAATRVIAGTPTAAGSSTITVSVNDGHSHTTSTTFTLTISAANVAPVVAATIPNQAGTVGTALSYTIPAGTFTDADGDTLTWSAAGLPAGLSFTAATRVLTGTPTAAGSSTVTVSVNDGHSHSTSTTFTLTISAANVAPVVAATIPNLNGTVGTALSYTIPVGTFTDADGDTLTWSASGLPAGLSFTAATRVIAGTPTAAGSSTASVSVNDGHGHSTSTPLIIVIGQQAPVVSAATATPSPVTAATTTLSATASDDGGEANLTYTWTATGPASVAFSPNGTNSAKASTATFTQAGSYTLTVTARDATGLTGTRTVAVTVAQTATALSVSPTSASVQPYKAVDFNAVLADQFGTNLTTQPTLTWSVSGSGGTIDANGLFTAGAGTTSPSGGVVATTYVVTASGGGQTATALVTVSTASTASASGTGGGCGSGGTAGLIIGLGLMLRLRSRRR